MNNGNLREIKAILMVTSNENCMGQQLYRTVCGQQLYRTVCGQQLYRTVCGTAAVQNCTTLNYYIRNLYSEKRAFCEILRENVVKSDWSQMKI